MWVHLGQTWAILLDLLEASLMLDYDAYFASLYMDDDVDDNPTTASSLDQSISADLVVQQLYICTSFIASVLTGRDFQTCIMFSMETLSWSKSHHILLRLINISWCFFLRVPFDTTYPSRLRGIGISSLYSSSCIPVGVIYYFVVFTTNSPYRLRHNYIEISSSGDIYSF